MIRVSDYVTRIGLAMLAVALIATVAAAPADAATIFKIDIDSTEEVNSVDTEPGFTSLNATASNSVTVNSVTFTEAGSEGNRNRNDPASDLLTDFLFNENSGDVGLQISGLPEGIWAAKVWSFDAGGNSFEEAKNQNVGVKDGSNRTVFVTGFDDNDQNPATFQFDTADFANTFTIFTDGTEGTSGKKRARFNGLELRQVIPEPASVGLGVAGLLGMLARRPRRPSRA